MEFSVLDKQTIQCVMTEAEIADYGMDRQLIYQNDERVADFFRQVMQRAKRETGFLKNGGSIAVHAEFLSDESLEITFSAMQKGLLQEKGAWQGRCQKTEPAGQGQEAGLAEQLASGMEIAVMKSKSLMHIVDFCKKAPAGLEASLYRYREAYFLLADVKGYGAHDTAALFNLADEYMDGICYTKGIAAFIEEHGQCIIKGHAAMTLMGL